MIRNTKQRQIILHELKQVCTHPNASEIFKLVNKNHKISQSTVYRNLDILESENLIIKLKIKNKKARYDGNTNKHCHLFCKECGEVFDLFDIKDVKIKSENLNKMNFKIDYNFLELEWICEKCQKK